MNIARSLTLALLAASFCAAHAGALPERVRKAAQERVDAGQYPALVIAYLDGGDSEIAAFGKLDDGKAPDADTVFEIGSITKTFTATLLALEVQSGKLKLDESAATLLPDFKIPARGGKPITLLDLAEQHSGLPRMPDNFKPADPRNPYADYGTAKLKEFLSGYALPRDPGASYEYSNLGFGLLGYALARNEHADYSNLVESKILRPLGMKMSATTFTPAMRAHLAPGHSEDGKPTANWDFDAVAGAGAIRSTSTDMLRYLKANMEVSSTSLTRAMKFAQLPRRGVGEKDRIGLAWMTLVGSKEGVIWHNGATGGYRSFIGFRADGRRGVVVLTNVAISADDLGFAALLDDAPVAATQRAISVDAAKLADYVGIYKLKDDFLITVTQVDGQLLAQASGQSSSFLFPSPADEFLIKENGMRFSFSRDPSGKVNGFVLHQNDAQFVPKLDAAEAAVATKSTLLEPATLLGYVGKYQLAPGALFDITVNAGQLYARLANQPALPVFASAKDKFFYTVVDARLDFEHDADGKVVALILRQNGRNQRALRVAQ
jgi:CubicO group peptidase (beta-lactamase class C family)